MDGNVLLIKMIQDRPAIWMNNFHSKSGENKKIQSYEDISKIMGINTKWIISRWNLLRNRFYKEYKTNSYEKKNHKVKFKYFTNMSFLKENLRMKNVPDFKKSKLENTIFESTPEFIIEENILKNLTTSNNYFLFNEQVDSCKSIKDIEQHDKKDKLPISNDKNRSEDIIFGELVAAMLKDMPIVKKKYIKKQIMNLMLS